jgi:hypothetical protein
MKKWQALLITAILLALLAVAIWLWWKPLMTVLGERGELIQSADSLLSILAALGSLASATFSFLSARGTKAAPLTPAPAKNTNVNTGGGAYVRGNVNTGGGDFVGRDKKVAGGGRVVAISGNVSGSVIASGDGNVVENIQSLFAPVYHAIEQASLPAQDKADIKDEVHNVETEVTKGEVADQTFLARRLRNLKRMAPDIGELLLSTLAGPGAVVSTVVRKVAEKVKNES